MLNESNIQIQLSLDALQQLIILWNAAGQKMRVNF